MQLTNTVCDLCYDAGKTVDAVKTKAIVMDGKPIEADVCEPHDKAITEALAAIYKVGRRPGKTQIRAAKRTPEPPTGEHRCDVEGCGRSFPTVQGLSMHKTRAHGMQSNSPEAKRHRDKRVDAA